MTFLYDVTLYRIMNGFFFLILICQGNILNDVVPADVQNQTVRFKKKIKESLCKPFPCHHKELNGKAPCTCAAYCISLYRTESAAKPLPSRL